jgi:hypothetical protein
MCTICCNIQSCVLSIYYFYMFFYIIMSIKCVSYPHMDVTLKTTGKILDSKASLYIFVGNIRTRKCDVRIFCGLLG